MPSTANTGEMLTAWYRKQAARVDYPKVEEYAARMGLNPREYVLLQPEHGGDHAVM